MPFGQPNRAAAEFLDAQSRAVAERLGHAEPVQAPEIAAEQGAVFA